MTSFPVLFLQNAAMLSGDAADSDAMSEDEHHSVTHPQEVLSKKMQWALLKHRCHLHQLSVRVSSSPLRPSQDKQASPSHLLGGTEAHPPPPMRLRSNLRHMISGCRGSRDHLAPNAQGGCHPQNLRSLTLLQAHQPMGKPLSHPSRRPAAALSSRQQAVCLSSHQGTQATSVCPSS